MLLVEIWLMTLFGGVLAGHGRFVYPEAPENQVQNAFFVGSRAKDRFLEMITPEMTELDQMDLYAESLMQCSSVAPNTQQYLLYKIGSDDGTFKQKHVMEILKAVGFDDVSSRLFSLSKPDILEVVRAACLKNELQFQCAHGFYQNLEKVNEHIQEMKKIDGNLNIMFEQECRAPAHTQLQYACVGKATSEVAEDCRSQLKMYNKTRRVINFKIEVLTEVMTKQIERELKEVALLDEQQQQEAMDKLHEELSGIMSKTLQLEDIRCRQYSVMEKCFLESIKNYCPSEVIPSLETVLRMGQLSRERGPKLTEIAQLLETQPSPHCSRLA